MVLFFNDIQTEKKRFICDILYSNWYQTQSAVRRLSSLSNSLGLLTKIENHEFSNLEDIDLSATINDMLNEFSELLELKSISLTTKIDKDIHTKAD